ncbi:guanine nucleotide-binding protein G(s) subunit alpha-like [Saccoglossus kowalevskii]|uniref:Guanine nucleotide-binding protein G(s) subunit alpha n=1 Tax=Saccoglossus kowalevskii TaxID=10224 RepID=A0ABM0MH15_SACKO|nr:PREDICTED: guanine nucleotide-binding protein G(s) subunit alpha-like [Saccoglossus kowalevskii]
MTDAVHHVKMRHLRPRRQRGDEEKMQKQASRRSKEIDRFLKTSGKTFWDFQKRCMKLLLLGAGESGKSTIMKQMKILHEDGFSDEERQAIVDVIRRNLHDAIMTITMAMSTLTPSIELSNSDNQCKVKYIQDEMRINERNYDFPQIFFEHVQCLWDDDGVRQCYERSNEYQLIDSAKYFLDRADKIGKEDFVPSDQDILRSRSITTGIFQTRFSVKGVHFHMFDVGGQRDQRMKWIQLFNDTTAIIFVAACSGYDLVLREDPTRNRLMEALDLFRRVWNNRYLKRVSAILFLNKCDILAEKVITGRTTIRHYFADYTDYSIRKESAMLTTDVFDRPTSCFCLPNRQSGTLSNSERRSSSDGEKEEILKAKTYILDRFTRITEEDVKLKNMKFCYPHYTCAVDTKNIERVFNDCRNIIQREHLRNYDLL